MRIFVGGLPRTATKDDIVRLFRQFGAGDDDVVLPRDRRTRRRKGFAYVEIPDAARADAAIATFANFEIDGKALTVCRAEDRPPKRPRKRMFAVAGIIAAAVFAAAPARADVASTDAALTLNPLFGTLVELRHRSGPVEIVLGGLPPIASAASYDALQGHSSTHLSIFDGTIRIWDALRRFSAGVGETVYNQSTHYADAVEIPGTGDTQYSRVAGAHYELGYRAPYRAGSLEAALAVAPRMLGTQFTQ
ncbi:MAG: hypothetical protein ABR591_09770 [Candidatus Velthaea sp.]